MRVLSPAFSPYATRLGEGILVDQRWPMEWEWSQWYLEDLPVGAVCELQLWNSSGKPAAQTKRVKIEPGTGVQRAEW
jgi:hypothetical protein